VDARIGDHMSHFGAPCRPVAGHEKYLLQRAGQSAKLPFM
jgi:hypothetical protein